MYVVRKHKVSDIVRWLQRLECLDSIIFYFHLHKHDYCCCCCWVASVGSDTVRPHRWQPSRLPRPCDSPGKNTGMGCHFLLQFMKVKSKSEVAQSCPTLSDPMDCGLSGSSARGILQARVLSGLPCLLQTLLVSSVHFSSVAQSCPTRCYSLLPHESQHDNPPCPSHLPEFTQTHIHWVGDAIQPSHPSRPLLLLPPIPPSIRVFSNESTLCMGGQSTGVSALASVLPMNTQDWSPLEWTGWISLQSKGLETVFSNTTVQEHQFFGTQPSSQSNSHIHTWPQEKP